MELGCRFRFDSETRALALTSGCKGLQENFRVVQNWVIQVVYNFLPAAKQVLTGPLL